MAGNGSDLVSNDSGSPMPDAGFLNDARTLATDIGKPDPSAFDLVVDGATYGLDVLGAVMDPLNCVFGAAVGLIVDMIPPLKWTIDALAGDPQAIENASTTWFNVGSRLIECGRSYSAALGSVTSDVWGSDAANGYRAVAETYIAGLEGTGGFCFVVGLGVTAGGMLCATVRAELFQALTDMVIEMAIEGAVALAAAVPTFGASVEAFIALAEMHFAMEAAEQAARLSELTSKLAHSGSLMAEDAQKVQKLSTEMKELSEALEKSSDATRGLSKQLTGLIRNVSDVGEKIMGLEEKGNDLIWGPGSQLVGATTGTPSPSKGGSGG